ncbi:DNA/RNA helicase domain-containing protein [Streptomyces roseoverticillatus]|uniref:DNA/RNA helicase domain-containing protein n=1 Tax=Streptomyces roseoverticillatus TaxID=66429 RepID=UPI00340E582E
MFIYAGTVADAAERIKEPGFFEACAERFSALHRQSVGTEERQSWERSWPALLEALVAAGAHKVHLLLEYLLPGTGERVDALLLGRETGSGELTAVVLELKQWTTARRHPGGSGLLRVGQRDALHPCRQVGGYVHYLTHWLPENLGLTVRGAAVVHDAAAEFADMLRAAVKDQPSGAFPLLARDDLLPLPNAEALASRLGCDGLHELLPGQVQVFLEAHHRPSAKLLNRFAATVSGHDGFTLIGDQDRARQAIHAALRPVGNDTRRKLVVITGGPGTGKTAIATRTLGDLCLRSGANPRLMSPSGTLTQQLLRAVGPQAKGLISTLGSSARGLTEQSVVLLDEAHRARTGRRFRRTRHSPLLISMLQNTAALVLFLDERQIIRPGEGTTLPELQELAAEMGADFQHIDLVVQFRCSGSQAYQRWIDTLFSTAHTHEPWAGNDYDLTVASCPCALDTWVGKHIATGNSARITAGFCWPWNAPDRPPLPPEVSLPCHHASTPHTWARPWNLRADRTSPSAPRVPGRVYWATDDGGHEQIGCIYTAQGLEYDYGGVIIGPDLIRVQGGWEAHPERSHDPAMRSVSPADYLVYALNTYRVLATRGTRGTCLYSSDPATQRFLRSLQPDQPGQSAADASLTMPVPRPDRCDEVVRGG